LIKVGTGTLTLSGINTYGGGTTVNAGTLLLSGAGTLGHTDNPTVVSGGTLDLGGTTQTQAVLNQFGGTVQNGTINVAAYQIAGGTLAAGTTVSATNSFDMQAGTVNGVLEGAASLSKTTAGTVTLSGVNTYSGGTFIDGGVLSFSQDSNLGAASGGLTFNGGTLRDTNLGLPLVLSPTRAITLNSAGGTFDVANGGPFDVLSISSPIGGPGGLTKIGAGNLVLFGTNSYGGATDINAGTLEVGNGNAIPDTSAVTVAGGAALALGNNETIGSLAGAGNVFSPISSGNVTLTTGADNSSTTFSGVISNGTALNLTLALTKVGTGTMTLSGNNAYTGPTTINAGTLSVNGSIASSTLTTVNAGGTLGGNGIVGNTTINGGTLSPGNSIGTLTVQGSLMFTAASSYMVEVSPSAADRTNVTGTATLGGATVNASFASGSYVPKQYTIVNAAGGINGTFGSLVSTNLPSTFTTSLSYDANNAYLNLDLALSQLPGLNGNQRNVANALIGSFNATGGIPVVFGTLTPAGLTQASGETATGSQQTTFNAMTQFITTLLDPFISGRGDIPVSTTGATPFAEEGGAASAYASAGGKRSTGAERDAYGMITKAVPRNPVFDPRWSVWAAGFGGSQTTDGNAALGSNDTTSRVFGVAAGADYIFSPRAIAGFALAGGGTQFSVANGGTGRSDLFQAGAFVKHRVGPAYVAGALAYGWQDITTDRTVTIAGVDRLHAQFNANAFSGRVEGGYRFATPWTGITPYAAGQFTTFDLPAYAEQALSGANTFALAYGSKSVTASRNELGLRTDNSWAMPNAILTLRGRFAWAHDYNADRNIAATFQTLPGASFVVNGAAQARDSALTTASIEMKWLSGWSAAAIFEGEFSDVSRSYAGKGVARYAW
jgi:autotransporter-associated beta strand protein